MQEAQEMQWEEQQQRHAAAQAAWQVGQGIAEVQAAQHHRRQDNNAPLWGGDMNWDDDDDHMVGGGEDDGKHTLIVNDLHDFSKPQKNSKPCSNNCMSTMAQYRPYMMQRFN